MNGLLLVAAIACPMDGDWFAEGELFVTNDVMIDVITGTRTPVPSAPGMPLDVSPDRTVVLFLDPFASTTEVPLVLVPVDGTPQTTMTVQRSKHAWISDQTHCILETAACHLWQADHLEWHKTSSGWSVDLIDAPHPPPSTREPTSR